MLSSNASSQTSNLTFESRVLIVGTSLNAGSKSWIMANAAGEQLRARGVAVELISLRDLKLPFAGEAEGDRAADVAKIKAAFKRATHIVLAMPIYNGEVNAPARNLVNLGCDFRDKTVSFLCAAGGDRCYLGVYPLANSLMLEFECWIVPRHVYATGNDFAANAISNPDILKRIDAMLNALLSRQPAPALAVA